MKGGGRGLLQTEAEKITIAEYLNTKYAQDLFVNVDISHKHNQPDMNSTTKTAVEDAGEYHDPRYPLFPTDSKFPSPHSLKFTIQTILLNLNLLNIFTLHF
jgi:hypothetical protein